MRIMALPFDNIISKFEGIIDCINNNFNNYYPKIIKRENVFVGTQHQEADKNGNRYLYRGKYFAFTHHDLMNKDIIDKFNERIKRLIYLLENSKEEILFVRTVMDDDEINLVNKFIIAIQKRFPNLTFNIVLIYDNKNMEQKCWNYNNKFIIVNSCHKTINQNAVTNKEAYKTFFDFIKNKKTLKNIFSNINLFPDDLILTNDKYKGWAMKLGIYPYLDDN
tara:strand:+ start:1282 stop:1944 length:663 start_codon:yes stop_codon:yes gene_type:complete